jgi:hypothetical protein
VEPTRLFSFHTYEGTHQYKTANARLSIWHFQKALEIFPAQWFTWHQLAITYSQLVGDLNEALRLWRHARQLRERLFAPSGGKLKYRFLSSMWTAQVGHIANMEHLIKREILQGGDAKNLILTFDSGREQQRAARVSPLKIRWQEVEIRDGLCGGIVIQQEAAATRPAELTAISAQAHRFDFDRQALALLALDHEVIDIFGLHDAVIAGCRHAGVTPRFAHTPSLIGTVMSYVEAGAGIGVVTESVVTPAPVLHFVLLKPVHRVPLVFVWQEDDDSPPVQRFRELLLEWKENHKLWHEHS